jgi:ankyrin repeat protein
MKHLLLTTIAAVVLVGTAFADPIHEAAANGDLAGVQAELDKGVDVNAKDENDEAGWTPLHRAADAGHKGIAELLIAAGADVNAKNDGGTTALDQAIGNNHTEIIDLLRKHASKTGKELKAEGK